jgi:hypothetical protein
MIDHSKEYRSQDIKSSYKKSSNYTLLGSLRNEFKSKKHSWKIEHENNKHANIAAIDILTIVIDLLGFCSFAGLVTIYEVCDHWQTTNFPRPFLES